MTEADNSPNDIILEQYKVSAAWSLHLLDGIQERIEKQIPDLKKLS